MASFDLLVLAATMRASEAAVGTVLWYRVERLTLLKTDGATGSSARSGAWLRLYRPMSLLNMYDEILGASRVVLDTVSKRDRAEGFEPS